MSNVIEELKLAFHKDDAGQVSRLLNAHPDAKAMINEPIGPFDSPAITCVKSRQMLDVLLEAGADINAKSRWWAGGFGLLHSAEPALAQYAIQRGAVVDAHAAARLGMFEQLKALLEQDPSLVHARGGDGQTPLHFASTMKIAEFLLKAGADINSRDVDHESTPVQWMVRDRNVVARFLVRRGCRTDLLLAAALGDLELVKKHLKADPNCVWMDVSEEYFPKVNARAAGTIYTWTLGANKLAHELAKEFGHAEVLRTLIGNSPPTLRLVVACELAEPSLFEELRQDLNAQMLPQKMKRRIADAARNNKTATVRMMLEAGWPVDAVGQHGATPLHWAAFHGNADMAEAILRKNPPLEMRDKEFNSTPLGWAIYGSTEGWECERGDYAATVEALLRAGARLPEGTVGSEKVQQLIAHWNPGK